MDSRIIKVTENLMRKHYKLNPDYEVQTCNVKKSTVEMTMHNGLVELKAKFPRTMIEDIIETMEEEDEEDEE